MNAIFLKRFYRAFETSTHSLHVFQYHDLCHGSNQNHWKGYCFYFQGSGWGSHSIITFTLVLLIKKYLWPFNIKLNPNTALRRTIDGRASFYNARLFFVVLGVQNWVPIEHGHFYRIINTSDKTTQRNVKITHRTSAEKII